MPLCAAPRSARGGGEGGGGGGDDGGGGGGLGAGFFVNEEEVRAGAGARASMLDHYDSLLHMPSGDQLDQLLQRDPSRFEDEEEETAAMAEG